MPLTTHTFSTGAIDVIGTVSATDEQRLPSGAFSLRNGFPGWFGQARWADDSRNASRRVSDNSEANQKDLATARIEGQHNPPPTQNFLVVRALAYLKASFEDLEILDNLPLEVAANPGAWYAWRSYRGLPKEASRAASPAQEEAGKMPKAQKQPGDWNWEGVFEKRVGSAIGASISDPVLFGSSRPGALGSEMIRFRKIDEEHLDVIREDIVAAVMGTR